ncbi:MAG: CRTAC1 family protein, partial [Verrucomicrobia bacterium]
MKGRRRTGRRWRAVAGLGWLVWIAGVTGAGGGPAAAEPVAPENGGWFEVEGGRALRLAVPAEGRPGFTRMEPARTGVAFTNVLSAELASRNRILHNGSGVALGDVDGDGRCDVYFCRLEGPNVLYRNLGGWRFEDITARAGVACEGQWSTGAAFADVDGDGDLDLLVNGIGAGTREFLNDGSGRFEEVRDGRLTRRFGATSLALADIDGDGDLDLYVANYRTDTSRDRPPGLEVKVWNRDGRIEIEPKGRFVPGRIIGGAVEVIELGERDFLYLNDGRGRFLPISFTRGNFLDAEGRPLEAPPQTWGLSVVLRDLNGDRIPDIYVCSDFFRSRDVIFLSEGRGRYREPSWEVFRNMTLSAMGMDVGDLDRDGYDDLLVTEMVSQHHAWRQRQRPEMNLEVVQQAIESARAVPEVVQNTLQHANGDGTYSEIARLAGLDYSEWSWDALFLDVDLDGWEDVLIPTGNLYDVQDADVAMQAQRFRQLPDTPANRLASWAIWPPLRTPIGAWRNRRDLTFEPVGPSWGFDQPGIWQGSALADLDGDGDLDLVVNQLNGPAGLFRNDGPAPRLAVRLRGPKGNRFGVGASIRVRGGPVVQTQQMLAGGRYLSSDDYQRVFAAAGVGPEGLTVEVTWPDGRRTVHRGLPPNSLCELWHEAPDAGPAPKPPAPKPLLGDLTRSGVFRHQDAPWNDFARQPLLSRKFSREGPGLAWVDFDQDGRVDLLMGGGRGGALQGFRNLGRGRFQPVGFGTNVAFRGPHGTVLSWREGGRRWLAVVRDHYEGPPEAPGEVVLLGQGAEPPIHLPAPTRSVP